MVRKATTRKPKATPSIDLYANASVDHSQVVNRYTTRARPDMELVARAMSNTVYAACNIKATVAGTQNLKLMRAARGSSKVWTGKALSRKALDWHKGEGKFRPGRKALAMANTAGDVEEVLEHPVLDTLYRPAPDMTFSQWLWLLCMWQEMTGRAYIWTGEQRLNPSVLYPLAPQYTNVIGSKSQIIQGYRYGRDTTGAIDLRKDEVVYFRERIHPSDPLGAVSWTHSVTLPSDMENAAFQSEVRRWENGAMPGGVIEMQDNPTPDQKKQRRLDFEQAYRGVNKAGLWMMVYGGKVNPSAVKPHELGYKDGMTLAEERIYRAASIPEPVWRMNDANRASALEGDPQFMGYAILPSLNALADKLTEEVLPRFEGTEGYWFAFDNPVAEDRKAVLDECVVLSDKGIITGNQVLTRLGQDTGGPELDVLRYGGTPLTLKDAPPPPPPVVPGADPDAPKDDPKEPEPEDEPPAKEPAEEVKAAPLTPTQLQEVAGILAKIADKPDTIDAHSLTCQCGKHTVTKSVTDAEREFARALHQWYDRAVRSSITPDGAMVRDFDQAELQRIIDTGLRNVFNESALASISETGADIGQTLVDNAAANYARERAAELVTNVTETLRQQVRDNIVQGIEQGRTINEIRDELASSGIADTRTETIVRTETSMAVQGAARRTYAEAGWEGKYWSPAGGPCPLCEAIEMKYPPDKAVPISQPYFTAGESIIGTDGKVYTFTQDIQDGVAHPNCVLPETRVAGGSAFAATRATYTGNVVTVRTKHGRVLTATENHRVLTGRGWMKVGAIQQGENLVGAGRVESALFLPDKDDRPPTIEQVFRTARQRSTVFSSRVPASTEHFHGDGAAMHGEVEIETANGLLMRDGNAAIAQQLCETAFKVGDSKLLGLTRECSLDTLLLATRLAADGVVTGARQATTLLGGHVGVADVHRFAASTLAESDGVDGPDNIGTLNAELLGECLDALAPFGVEFDEVVSVERLPYSGHVYDLSTVSGAYVSNGIISHNCRCSSIYTEVIPQEATE